MSIICLSTNSFPLAMLERSVYKPQTLTCRIARATLSAMLPSILSEFCDATVIGYDQQSGKYWCKIDDRARCSLHVELDIVAHTTHITLVNIEVFKGSASLADNFAIDLAESIHLYTTSPFIRGILNDICAFK